jgi:hypothetical protein
MMPLSADTLNNQCHECARLLSQYIDATAEHVRIDGQIRMAELQHDESLVKMLSIDAQNLAEHRTRIRLTIMMHKEKEHLKMREGKTLGSMVRTPSTHN